MLKVLIVDDEMLVRSMLTNCLDWKGLGFEIAGEASSSRMALEMVESIRPDVVFMDIQMPVTDGLTCSRMILEKQPQTKIIILSGHDDFEYASESIKIGIFDYLLKPINTKEVTAAAIKARDAILATRSKQQEYERYKEELKKNAPAIRDRQLSAYVRSRTPKQYREALEYFGVVFRSGCYQVALCEVLITGQEDREEDKLLMKMHLRKLIDDYFGDVEQVFCFDSGADWVIILNNENPGILYELSENLQTYLENNIGLPVCIGIGDVYENEEQVSESYREAKDSIKYRFAAGNSGIISYRDLYFYDHESVPAELTESEIRSFVNAVRMCDKKEAARVNAEVCERLRQSGQSRDTVIIQGITLLAEMQKVLTEQRVSLPETLEFGSIVSNFFQIKNIDEAEQYLQRIITESIDLLARSIGGQEADLTAQIVQYIDEHYGDEELSLNLIAARFFVNPSYLSRTFKKKTGMNFSAYLFQIRMKEAERLARLTDLKAFEIGERVGIPDPHYFSVCFKKHTGKSISNYQKER